MIIQGQLQLFRPCKINLWGKKTLTFTFGNVVPAELLPKISFLYESVILVGV